MNDKENDINTLLQELQAATMDLRNKVTTDESTFADIDQRLTFIDSVIDTLGEVLKEDKQNEQ